jgi:hypothetical protein
VAGLACAVVCGLPSSAYAQSVTANCDTPPSNRDSCDHWYTAAAVTLGFDWTAGGIASGCGGGTFTAEGRVDRTCIVDFVETTIIKKVWLGIDRTPPQIVGYQPDRPPDANGWFNRPVGLTFQASDPVSGVASCSSTTYAGPDGAGVPIAGTCRDVAGNVGSGLVPLNYDATPPKAPSGVKAIPGNRRVALAWRSTPGVEVEVARAAHSVPAVVVFRGHGSRLTDRGLHNGKRYRYIVTLIDQAGNRAAAGASAVPTASQLLLPARGAHLRNAPTLMWKRVRRATYYNAQVLFRGRKVLSSWPGTAQLKLHRSWRFNGRIHRLVPGRYCWYVWPGFGKRAAHRYGRLLGRSCFTVVRR